MSTKLNGWQRIWIVIGVLLLIPAGMILFYEWETKNDVYSNWADATIRLMLTLEKFKDSDLTVYNVRNAKGYRDMSSKELLDRIQNKYSAPEYNLDFSQINAGYKEKLGTLPKDNLIYLAITGGGWLIIMVVLYISGWSIGWVIRGFKK